MRMLVLLVGALRWWIANHMMHETSFGGSLDQPRFPDESPTQSPRDRANHVGTDRKRAEVEMATTRELVPAAGEPRDVIGADLSARRVHGDHREHT